MCWAKIKRSKMELGWQYKYEFRAFCDMTKIVSTKHGARIVSTSKCNLGKNQHGYGLAFLLWEKCHICCQNGSGRYEGGCSITKLSPPNMERGYFIPQSATFAAMAKNQHGCGLAFHLWENATYAAKMALAKTRWTCALAFQHAIKIHDHDSGKIRTCALKEQWISNPSP